jgi:hypothetical protein
VRSPLPASREQRFEVVCAEQPQLRRGLDLGAMPEERVHARCNTFALAEVAASI